MRDPFRIEGPACISFSGGRTSGYMLWRILQAHGGKLPDDVVVLFANTGKEMPETLDFVQECSERWGVPIVWLEYGRSIVDYKTASRNGEPFDLLTTKRSYLPNPVTRFCTQELKIKLIEAHCKSLGWDEWTTAVGLRADEQYRVAKMRNQASKISPLFDAGLGKDDVRKFWTNNSFDLRLPYETHSNCDLCFLKGADQIMSLIREKPERATWWITQEQKIGATFRSDRPTYAQMLAYSESQVELFGDEPLQDCACTD